MAEGKNKSILIGALIVSLLVLGFLYAAEVQYNKYQSEQVAEWMDISLQSFLLTRQSNYLLEVCHGDKTYDSEQYEQIEQDWEEEWSEELEWIGKNLNN